MSADILPCVAALMAEEFGVDAATIVQATELAALGLDSMDRVELAMRAEDLFHVRLPDGAEMDWQTVGDIVEWLSASIESTVR